MADISRGELVLTVDGTTYTLVLDINAMCLLEAKHSTPEKRAKFTDLLAGVADGTVSSIREVVWAALQTHHQGMTIEDAGRLIQAAGGVLGFARALGAMLEETTPDARDVKELGITPRPPKAQADKRPRGIGEKSTSTHAVSA